MRSTLGCWWRMAGWQSGGNFRAKVKKKGQLLLLRSTKLLCVLGKLGLGGLCTFYGIRGAPREGAAAPLLAVGAGLRARTQASREWEPMQDVL